MYNIEINMTAPYLRLILSYVPMKLQGVLSKGHQTTLQIVQI